jgi:hypothetical protein
MQVLTAIVIATNALTSKNGTDMISLRSNGKQAGTWSEMC